ncbi:hypothetical protein niasHT_012977 [Heterodera trifolii]|uniref:Uncharacterized protein n=1 Tax=Heterodera trifolii TaxID=157864 RepID=A0ABD2L3F5_9BILA
MEKCGKIKGPEWHAGKEGIGIPKAQWHGRGGHSGQGTHREQRGPGAVNGVVVSATGGSCRLSDRRELSSQRPKGVVVSATEGSCRLSDRREFSSQRPKGVVVSATKGSCLSNSTGRGPGSWHQFVAGQNGMRERRASAFQKHNGTGGEGTRAKARTGSSEGRVRCRLSDRRQLSSQRPKGVVVSATKGSCRLSDRRELSSQRPKGVLVSATKGSCRLSDQRELSQQLNREGSRVVAPICRGYGSAQPRQK